MAVFEAYDSYAADFAVPGDLLALLAAGRPEWHGQAACRGARLDFYDPSTRGKRAARAVCRTCPVQAECAAWASTHAEWGMWGGRTSRGQKQKPRLLRQQLPQSQPRP